VLLLCPRCAELDTYGPTGVLGELVVCHRCHTPFGWQESGDGVIAKNRDPKLNPNVAKESST
jgi:hypothetical protein